MVYMGSKNRYAKYIVPILQEALDKTANGYLELFVGGANIIDKISHSNKIGVDNNKYLIALLKQAQDDFSLIPTEYSHEEYGVAKDQRILKDKDKTMPDYLIGAYGFITSYLGRYFEGFQRDHLEKNRYYHKERRNNLLKQSIGRGFKDINFINDNYLCYITTNKIEGMVIYCDPPYEGTKRYNHSSFRVDLLLGFLKLLAKDNMVFLSYNKELPFEKVWDKDVIYHIGLNKIKNNKSTEYLYQIKG